MRRLMFFCSIALAIPFAHAAESFESAYNRANALLRSGEADEARQIYRELQVDNPEDPALYFGIGCATYEEALQNLRRQDDANTEVFEAAQSAFEKAATSSDPSLTRDARFNMATATARRLIADTNADNAEETVDRYRQAIDLFEGFLEEYPEHEGAQQNLDHLRYALKRLLQQPPPDETAPGEEGEQGEEGEPQGDNGDESQQPGEEQQDQTGKPSEGDETEAQRQEGDQDDSQPGMDQQDRPQDQPEEQSEDDISPEELVPDRPNEQKETNRAPSQVAQGETPSETRQEIDALLQSLEDIDRMEQRNLRRAPLDDRIRQEWW